MNKNKHFLSFPAFFENNAVRRIQYNDCWKSNKKTCEQSHKKKAKKENQARKSCKYFSINYKHKLYYFCYIQLYTCTCTCHVMWITGTYSEPDHSTTATCTCTLYPVTELIGHYREVSIRVKAKVYGLVHGWDQRGGRLWWFNHIHCNLQENLPPVPYVTRLHI